MPEHGIPLDPALTAQRPHPTQLPLDPHAVEWLMICFAHDRQLFEDGRNLIGAHHFLPHEEPLRILYLALCDVVDVYVQVTPENLTFAYQEQMRGNPNLVFGQEQLDAIFGTGGLLAGVACPEAEMSEGNIAFGRQVLQRFVYERTVVAPIRRMVNQPAGAGIPKDMDDFLAEVNQQAERIATLNMLPILPVMPEMGTPLVAANEFKLTGVSFIDNLLGGDRIGDANGIIGPTSGGKTTLAVDMAVKTAKQEWNDAQKEGREPGVVFFITAEESARKVRPRIWSAALSIPRLTLETLTDWGQLTTQATLKDYERRMQQGQEHILSESERYLMGHAWLTKCFEIIDLSGSEDYPEAGNGGIDEIVSVISRNLQRRRQNLRSTYIDYAGLICERYMQSKGMDERNYRHLLKRFADDTRKKISERFHATSWILHQMKGDAGRAQPTKLMHHTDAAESKDFANNLAVCLCLGVPDPLTGCRRLNPSKVRFRPNEKLPPVTLRIDDEFAVMVDVTDNYVAEEAGGRFMTTAEADSVGGVEAVTQRGQQGQQPPLGLSNHPTTTTGAARNDA